MNYQVDYKGDRYYSMDDEIFRQASNGNKSISLSANGNYLVYKVEDLPYIYVMTICDTNTRYLPEEYSCEPCARLNKTFGMQTTQCLLCDDLYDAENSENAVIRAQFSMVCAQNLKKSRWLMVLTLMFGLIVGIGACIANCYFGKFFRLLVWKRPTYE